MPHSDWGLQNSRSGKAITAVCSVTYQPGQKEIWTVPGFWEASVGYMVPAFPCEGFGIKKPRKTYSLFAPHKPALPALSCVAIFDLVPRAGRCSPLLPSSDLFSNGTIGPCNPRCLKFPGPKWVLHGLGPRVHQSFSFALLPPGGRSVGPAHPLNGCGSEIRQNPAFSSLLQPRHGSTVFGMLNPAGLIRMPVLLCL